MVNIVRSRYTIEPGLNRWTIGFYPVEFPHTYFKGLLDLRIVASNLYRPYPIPHYGWFGVFLK